METIHGLFTSALTITENTDGFEIETNCHSVLIDNIGEDDAKIYFNNEEVDYALLKAGLALPINTDNEHELIADVIKIEFLSTRLPLINIIKQTKRLL